MTKAYYKAFPTVVTLEDAMRQALKSIAEIERLRAELAECQSEYQKLWGKYNRAVRGD
jgi:hypothetical protein